MKHLNRPAVFGVVVALALSACATDEFGQRRPMTDAEKGVLIGAATGAAVGAAAKKSDRGKGALIGAVGGGIAGGLVGNYMDNQKRDLEKFLATERNAGVIQIDKLAGDVIRVTMTSETAFAVDSSEIKGTFYSTMDKIARVANTYGKTTLTLVGHTDSTGSAAHNQALSERRAGSVLAYFRQKGVIDQRLTAYGRGKDEPRASNATAEGRALNRRVEIFIAPIIAEG
jgi:outer membrane protein OmpA-like peptidoglycan-associated protein